METIIRKWLQMYATELLNSPNDLSLLIIHKKEGKTSLA